MIIYIVKYTNTELEMNLKSFYSYQNSDDNIIIPNIPSRLKLLYKSYESFYKINENIPNDVINRYMICTHNIYR